MTLGVNFDISSPIAVRFDYSAPASATAPDGSAAFPLNVMSQGLLRNFVPSNLYKFRAALARQATGGAYARIVFAGDSITCGALADGTLGNYRTKSYPSLMATMLTAQGYPASSSSAFGSSASTVGIGQVPGYWDSRITGSGGFATLAAPFYNSFGGYAFASGVAGSINFAPGTTTDTCDIYYYDNAVGTFGTSINAGANITTVTVGTTNLVKKQNITYTAGVQTINVNWASGAVSIVGFNAWQSTVPQIQLINGALGGVASTTWNNDGAQILALGVLEVLAPDLSFYMIGTNDWIPSTAVNTTVYTAALNSFITGARLSGDVIFITPPPADSVTSPLATQATYVAAMNAVALANNVPIVDENANLVSKAQMTANGLGSDTNHPNNIGTQVIARDVTRALLTML